MRKHNPHYPQDVEAVAEALTPNAVSSIRFKLPGLRADFSEDDTFILVAPVREINYIPLMEALREQGLGDRLIDEAVEGMAEFIFSRQLAEHFAKRMIRIG